MADRTFYPSFSYGFARVFLDFFFMTNGTSSPSVALVDGVGQDVVSTLTRSGAGVIAVQLSSREKYNKVIFAAADLDNSSSGAGCYACIDGITNEGSATAGILFNVTTRAASGTATDFGTGGTGVSRRCYVTMSFRNSASGLK